MYTKLFGCRCGVGDVYEIVHSDTGFVCCVIGEYNADALLSHLNRG